MEMENPVTANDKYGVVWNNGQLAMEIRTEDNKDVPAGNYTGKFFVQAQEGGHGNANMTEMILVKISISF